MLKELESYDWQEAFGYAGEPGTCGSTDIRGAVPEKNFDLTPFTRNDVATITAMSEGENDGPSWMCYGSLNDGRWFYLEAGCDYTGWDCIASGSATIAGSKEECERFALTDEARDRMKVVLSAL